MITSSNLAYNRYYISVLILDFCFPVYILFFDYSLSIIIDILISVLLIDIMYQDVMSYLTNNLLLEEVY